MVYRNTTIPSVEEEQLMIPDYSVPYRPSRTIPHKSHMLTGELLK